MSKEKAIPDKMYFRIGETADLLGVKPYVLRYWETEFPDIKPVKSQSNQRLYKRKDVEVLVAIKRLLYDEKFTINGARQHLKDLMRGEAGKGEVKNQELFTESATARSKKESKAQAAPESTKKVFLKLKDELKSCLEDLRR